MSRSPLMECDRPSADSAMNKFISAMPSSICWPVGEKSQFECRRNALALERPAKASRANRPRRLTHEPRLVDTVTSGDVVTMRAASGVSLRAISLSSAPRNRSASTFLVGTAPAAFGRHRDAGGLQAALAIACKRHAIEKRLNFFCRPPKTLERIPFMAGPDVHQRSECFRLRRRHQASVIVLMPGKRQAVALDRVGDEANWSVMIDGVERRDDRCQIVAAEIVHEPRQLVVAALFDEPRDRPLVADLVIEALAPCRPALKHQRGIELVWTMIDPLAQHLTARLGNRGLLERAVFEHHHVPAEIAEQVFVTTPTAPSRTTASRFCRL